MSEQTAIDLLNKFARDYGIGYPWKTKNRYLYYDPPKDYDGTPYRFAYTPWKTEHKGKIGYFALKIRICKKHLKIVKAVRFGRRKIARDRCLEWYKKYYGRDPWN